MHAHPSRLVAAHVGDHLLEIVLVGCVFAVAHDGDFDRLYSAVAIIAIIRKREIINLLKRAVKQKKIIRFYEMVEDCM